MIVLPVKVAVLLEPAEPMRYIAVNTTVPPAPDGTVTTCVVLIAATEPSPGRLARPAARLSLAVDHTFAPVAAWKLTKQPLLLPVAEQVPVTITMMRSPATAVSDVVAAPVGAE